MFLKPSSGSGGFGVYKCEDLETLRAQYRLSGRGALHIQEAVEDYDLFCRCIAVGPQILITEFQAHGKHHQHYLPRPVVIPPELRARIEHYFLTLNAAHHWTFNSFECLIKNGAIHPIDFANANPETSITSLHVYFPWVIGALMRWTAFLAIVGIDMGDGSRSGYFQLLNDPDASAEEKSAGFKRLNEQFFKVAEFGQFCAENFPDLKGDLLSFAQARWMEIASHTILHSAQFHPDEMEEVRADMESLLPEFLGNEAYLRGL